MLFGFKDMLFAPCPNKTIVENKAYNLPSAVFKLITLKTNSVHTKSSSSAQIQGCSSPLQLALRLVPHSQRQRAGYISIRCVLSCLVMSYSFATPLSVAQQALLSKEFSKKIGVGCHYLLQGIFPTQGSNPCHCIFCIGSQIH